VLDVVQCRLLIARSTERSSFRSNAGSAAKWPSGSAGETLIFAMVATKDRSMVSIFLVFQKINYHHARERKNAQWVENMVVMVRSFAWDVEFAEGKEWISKIFEDLYNVYLHNQSYFYSDSPPSLD
jgi:hypothetical protein